MDDGGARAGITASAADRPEDRWAFGDTAYISRTDAFPASLQHPPIIGIDLRGGRRVICLLGLRGESWCIVLVWRREKERENERTKERYRQKRKQEERTKRERDALDSKL